MYRKVFKVEKEEDLQIKLPHDYLNKEVEVIVIDVKAAEDAMKFFDSIQVDMSNFKFNRDEANER